MRTLAAFTSALLLPLLAPSASAQCGGNGPGTIEFIQAENDPIGPGSSFIMRLTGEPNSFFCLICDFGAGPVDVPGIGTFCVDLSQNLIEFVAELPASGVLEIPVTIPPLAVKATLCCQWFGVNTNRVLTGLSNAVCLKLNERCEKGINEIRYKTCIPKPARFPSLVDTRVELDGRTFGRARISSFDPKNPPRYPVSQDNKVFIEKITIEGDMLCVISRANAGKDSKGGFAFPGDHFRSKVCATYNGTKYNYRCWTSSAVVDCESCPSKNDRFHGCVKGTDGATYLIQVTADRDTSIEGFSLQLASNRSRDLDLDSFLWSATSSGTPDKQLASSKITAPKGNQPKFVTTTFKNPVAVKRGQKFFIGFKNADPTVLVGVVEDDEERATNVRYFRRDENERSFKVFHRKWVYRVNCTSGASIGVGQIFNKLRILGVCPSDQGRK